MKDNLAGIFLEIARNHIARKEVEKIENYCEVCRRETCKEFHRETKTSEFYKCVQCHVIFEYKVKCL